MNSNAIKFKNGRLVIMQVSDPQDLKYVRRAMVKMLDRAYDLIKPDLVLFTGDNILGNHLLDARIGNKKVAFGKEAEIESMTKAINHITYPLEKRNIPFAMIYGNHDDMNLVTKQEQADIFRKCSMCLPMNNDSPERDVDTYSIPVMSSDGKKQVFNLWMLDSAWYDKEQDKCFKEIKPSAVEWFRSESERMKAENGGKPMPSLMFLHIPLPAIMQVVKKYDSPIDGACGNEREGYFKINPEFGSGIIGEAPSILDDDAGLYDAIIECGGVKAVVSGHDHLNCFEARYNGIDFIQTPCASFRCYGNEARGVRVFILNENSPEDYVTYSLTYPDLCGTDLEARLSYIWDADDKVKEKAGLIAGACLGLTAGIAATAIRIIKHKNKV